MNIISAKELKDKIKHGIKVTVVNVLDEEYYKDCHIKGSINVPLSQLKTIANDWDKSREIVLYCASSTCKASKTGFNVLIELGFKKVAAYEEGMKEWKEKGYNCVGPCEKDYLN
ncbi:rhodanese-like domain-containing protein [Candidatus Babeliales bacterium]|nr:rhodanese-like domain-containing protein [Candidatus Babeliales bacterium]